MGPTEDTLGKDGLGDAVALQLRRDSLSQLFGVDLLDLTAAAATGGGRRVGRLEGGGGAAAGAGVSCATALSGSSEPS